MYNRSEVVESIKSEQIVCWDREKSKNLNSSRYTVSNSIVIVLHQIRVLL